MGVMTRTDTSWTSEEHTPMRSRAVSDVLAPRDVPLGGLRAMTVHRLLPHRARTTIGAWCFLDHFGPTATSDAGGMVVPPHPHTGLQTVTWLFDGAIEHRDSSGGRARITPGSANLMTAGSGIQHSEVSDPDVETLHGVQLWVALPDSHRLQNPHFDSLTTTAHRLEGGHIRLFIGSMADVGTASVPIYSPIMAAEITIHPGATLQIPLDESYEHGLLNVTGQVSIDDMALEAHHLGYMPIGHTALSLTNPSTEEFRGILIGGVPFTEPLVMWWNFIGRTHEDIELFRNDWQQGLQTGSTRFGHLDHMPALPAPEMPHVRLKSRL